MGPRLRHPHFTKNKIGFECRRNRVTYIQKKNTVELRTFFLYKSVKSDRLSCIYHRMFTEKRSLVRRQQKGGMDTVLQVFLSF